MRLSLSLVAVAALALISLFVGVGDVSLGGLFGADARAGDLQLLLASRIPRTVALILAGMSMAAAGMIMQMLARNRFVEPSTAGTTESATLGILAVTLFAPDMPVLGRMIIASLFAMAGTALFLRILTQIPLRSVLMVPLVGLMLGGVIDAFTTFFAYRFDLIQSLNAWTMGDFSAVLRGRYELIWLSGALVMIAFFTADRFTVAGLGEDFTTNLGLNYRGVLTFGLAIVAMVTAVVVTTVGTIPFLGLIVPNIASMIAGDNMRKSLPFVATFGAGFLLACDLIGRTVNFPYEIPIGTVVGVIGSAAFLWLLLRRRTHLA
ncbi:ABC transporter permease [Agaricicola taiwanensis]|uniref:ABC transporter permease n=1 Tax=Agaricicola taiwanensis TaxID=591372 RepID=UPI00280A5948|nr:ABC transporter permease [Agaricicola taiwanensis]